jgi:hypothetical protein
MKLTRALAGELGTVPISRSNYRKLHAEGANAGFIKSGLFHLSSSMDIAGIDSYFIEFTPSKDYRDKQANFRESSRQGSSAISDSRFVYDNIIS